MRSNFQKGEEEHSYAGRVGCEVRKASSKGGVLSIINERTKPYE